MGDLLRFPDLGPRPPVPGGREAVSGPSGWGSAQEGAEQDSAPSRVPTATSGVDPTPESAIEAMAEATDEPKWAVPGVDDGAPAPERESTKSSRRAENVAIATLTRHDASEGEVRAKLVAKGLEEDDVEAELDRLRRVGLIDDAAFAVRVIARLRDRKGLGDQAIRSALRGRLVPQAVIDIVLEEQAEDEETAEARLQEVADDRARRLGSLAPAVAERRLTAYLMRKGYSGSSVRIAVRAALEVGGRR